MGSNLEHTEQVSLMKWWELIHNSFSVPVSCLFAIPNGGLRNIITAKNMKSEGVRPGVPDLFLAWPCGKYHGMFIEMKRTKGGRVSDSQKKMLELLSGIGYHSVVCKGFDEARKAIESYLKQQKV